MEQLKKLLRDPFWQGLGVLIALLLGFVGFYYQTQDLIWLYLLGLSFVATFAFVLGAELQQRNSAVFKSGVYFFSAAVLLGTGYGVGAFWFNTGTEQISGPDIPQITDAEAKVITTTVQAANGRWQPTGVSAVAGQRVTFRVVRGEWNVYPKWKPNSGTGVDNNHRRDNLTETEYITSGIKTTFARRPGQYLPEACTGSLIARVGERIVGVGSQRSFVAQESGQIHLIANDAPGYFGDNTGALDVEIFLEPERQVIYQNVVEVFADKDWQRFPVNIAEGDRVVVEVVRGEWTKGDYYQKGEGNCAVCAHGNAPENCGEPIPEFNQGSLIARVGESSQDFIAIGKHYSFTAEQSGSLYLRMNDTDEWLYNNDGSLTVKVQVER